MPRYLVTAALPYANGKPHVGHIAGAYLPADIYARYRKARGDEVLFVCGSDDNGVAVVKTAREAGLTPQQTVDKFHAAQAAAFAGLGIEFDVFGGTHTAGYVETHTRFSQEFFRAIHAQGFFAKKSVQQWYDAAAGQFLPDRYVSGTCPHCGYGQANGDQCENCGKDLDALELKNPVSVLTNTAPEIRPTTHWFLRLDALEGRLREWLESKAAWRPAVRNFALGQIKEGLRERAMTRDLAWGVPVPLDDPDAAGKCLYVWFDAPVGYVSFTAQLLADRGEGPDAYAKWWKDPESRIVHFIGEDNTVFHALIWPAMLMAEGTCQLPHAVVANSFLNIKMPGHGEEKFSKSRGNAIWIDEFLAEYDPDPLRYYLTAIAPEGARTPYQPEEFIQRNDGELVAALGNLVNRLVPFAHKNYGGAVPAAGVRDDRDRALLALRAVAAAKVAERIEAFQFKAAQHEMMELARAANAYLAEKAPWTQRKTDAAAAGTTINVGLQVARALATLMAPFLPFSARKCAAMLHLPPGWEAWGRAADELPDAAPLGQAVPLFRKLAPIPGA